MNMLSVFNSNNNSSSALTIAKKEDLSKPIVQNKTIEKKTSNKKNEAKRIQRIRFHSEYGNEKVSITVEGVKVSGEWCSRAIRFYDAQDTPLQQRLVGMTMEELEGLVNRKTK